MSARRSDSKVEVIMEMTTAALKHGVGPVVALALVWWLTQSLDGKLDGHVQEQRLNLGLIRQICLNTATTESQRAGCTIEIGADSR